MSNNLFLVLFLSFLAGAKLLAKYSYKANPESPIGRELDMKQGDQLTLVSDVDAVWWKTENSNGEVGYVPASYVMVSNAFNKH